jgi:hypothetical protein
MGLKPITPEVRTHLDTLATAQAKSDLGARQCRELVALIADWRKR